ncbi:rhomboid family intramembrane serine protease [Robertkochia aurantiaca]|uniref:rhomboid family intramembrane serine protease n=1 Tax=Robertkochia aurantiaca TaxID=2873700 RepID=UPI001CCD567C|nr:rhomboid family intramembrane serine protease [Robertkochia sp. 3YJGBD-33]
MKQERELEFSLLVVIYPLFFAIIIWSVYWMELLTGEDLTRLGIMPRKLSGVPGIILSPFIHSSLEHLWNNTLPLIILSSALFYFYRKISWKVLIYGLLISGMLTWLIGRQAYHIGASGMIYTLVSFIFFKGIMAGNYRLIALSLLVVFLYGSMIWYVIPVNDEISWEGHLSGALAGLFLAFVYRTQVLQPYRYQWEREDYNEESDPFLQQFDEDGNFIGTGEGEKSDDDNIAKPKGHLRIKYHYREKED